MTITLYDASMPVLIRGLKAMRPFLAKAEQQAQTMKADEKVLLQSRLFPNMLPLIRQVQIACDMAKGAPARLSGQEPPSFPDTESTFAEIYARIDKTLAFAETFKPAQIADQEGRTVEIKTPNRTLSFSGSDYLFKFVLPNFYFHVTAAYALLRHNGIDIGKQDFLGAS